MRKILIWPDNKLEEISQKVDINEDHSLLIQDLIDTMQSVKGIGLAAPQIGILSRIIVIDESASDDHSEPLVMLNPEIVDGISDIVSQESCLSLPGLVMNIMRAGISIVKYHDQSGKSVELTATGMLSIAIQHEIDHLDGELIIDRMNRKERRRIKSDMIKLKKEQQPYESRRFS